MKFQVINGIDPKNDREAALITDVAGKFMSLVTAAWEKAPISVVFKPGATKVDPGFVPMFLLNTPDVDGAEGYHDITGGAPYAKVFLATVPGGEWLHDPSGQGQCLAAVAAHEFAEAALDSMANLWASQAVTDPQSGTEYNQLAFELCDPVQNYAFTINAADGTVVDVSDFVLPPFFDPEAPAGSKFSQMGIPTAPGQVTPGGYAIVQNTNSEGQIFARLGRALTKKSPKRIFHATTPPPEWREKMFEMKKYSRSKKRLSK